ncbi:MAG: hypothetical protein DVB25_07350 [Verrucomicrobia bacterium]|nr:MAG: hypothetical protein DVB25_07350 [Verrucomicrobiota bacterium]
MQRLVLPFVSLLAALALPSCLQQATTVHLNKDGSGTLVEETTFGAQMSAMLEQMGGLGGANAKGQGQVPDPAKEMASMDKAKARAATLGEGVTVEKAEAITVDGNKGGRVTYHFADINHLKLSAGSGLQDAMPKMPGAPEAEPSKALPTTFKYADGVLTITNPDREKPEVPAADKPKTPELDSAQMEPMMKQMLGDMKMSLKVVIEPGIASTTASHVKGNTVTLAEMDMGKVMDNPGAFKKLQRMDQKDPAKAMAALKDFKGVTVETQPQITIKLK